MAVSWTEEQKQVIEDRGHNLLVSAAAGSGKTAVLVERIIERVTDPEDPVDVDQLLVVTFTRAAAGEMKERLQKALEKKLEEDPANDHLQRQGVLLHNAQINTIHGFCQHVIKNYFHRIGLDPSYRIGQESDLRIMKGDILDQLMEDEYALLMGEKIQEAEEDSVPDSASTKGDADRKDRSDSASTKGDADRKDGSDSVLGFREEKEEGAKRSGNEMFGRLVEAYAPGKSDDKIPQLILNLYEKAISNPDPDEWLDSCAGDYQISTLEELEQSAWMIRITKDTHLFLESSLAYAKETLAMAARPGGPKAYLDALESDVTSAACLLGAGTFRELQDAFSKLEFQKLGRSRKAEAAEEDADLGDEVKERRNRLKKSLTDWLEKYFCDTEEEILEDVVYLRPYVEELVRLTREFTVRFREAKKAGNLADFSDLEHYALQILLEKKDGAYVRTEAARELAAGFKEVMVDEYQDSNLIQEALLQAVSGEEEGRHDRFMVGDMKQAIYGFRLARPEIFLEKYYRYGASDGRDGCRRIDLGRNFRSRREVLDPVNALFERLMQKALGGIDYDDAQALHAGAADYPEAGADQNEPEANGADQNKSEANGADQNEPEANGADQSESGDGEDRGKAASGRDSNPDIAELILVDGSNPALAETQTTAVEAEASAISARIHALMAGGKVYDRDLKVMRPVRFRDMVILLRSTSGTADTYVKVLKREGIPAYSVSREGYFSTLEVETVLNYLRLVDNSRQDEALASVLHSAIGGFSAEELADIAAAGQKLLEEETRAGGKAKKQETFYRRVFAFRDRGQEGPLKDRLKSFFEQLAGFRRKAPDTPVHQLIGEILEETGYGSYASAMPGGAQREANLRMLVDLGAAFEDGSQHGLFAFVRTIEEQNKYQIDTGEVNLYSENEDIVRVMTIHKSKGLEFPVVFLAGCGKKFNTQDSTASMVIHPSLGIGLDAVDPKRRLKRTTIRKAVLARACAMDNLAEELRVLYVAMTRTKEKLIMTGTVKSLENLPPDIARAIRVSAYERAGADAQALQQAQEGRDQRPVDYGSLTSASCYLDWILAAYSYGMPVRIMTFDEESLAKGQEEAGQNIEVKLEQLKKELADDKTFDPKVQKFLEERNSFSYPYSNLQELPAKMTVSEIKKTAYDAETAAILGDVEERGAELIQEETNDYYLPAFMDRQEKEKNRTSGRKSTDGTFSESAAKHEPAAGNVDQRESVTGRELSRGASAGAARGTIYHAFLEHLDYSAQVFEEDREQAESESRRFDLKSEVNKQLGKLSADGLFFTEDVRTVRKCDFVDFLDSDLGRRMAAADRRGQLHRETPFVLEVDAHTIRSEWPSGQSVLVQGVIDAWFFEGDGIVLVDYKTDHVYTEDGSDLIRKYRDQFLYYRQALERLTGARVKEMQLYSFGLGKAVRVE